MNGDISPVIALNQKARHPKDNPIRIEKHDVAMTCQHFMHYWPLNSRSWILDRRKGLVMQTFGAAPVAKINKLLNKLSSY